MANWGPGIADFSPIANLGQTFTNAYDRSEKRSREQEQRQALASLGQTLTGNNPDYLGAASKAFNSGDANTGLTLLKLGEAAKLRQQEVEASQSFGKLFGGGSASSAAPQASAPAEGASVAPASLVQNESGGNWQAQNNAVGAGGQRGHFGRLQFGQARLQEAAAAGAIPQGTTPQQFMASPEMQQRAEAWHFNDIDQFIRGNGLDKTIGQSINGVPVTLDGMRAVAHLGGKEGLAKFIASRGRYNPADDNGTSLMDYFSRHGGGGGQPTQVAAPITPVQSAPLGQPGVQVAENEQDVQRLEAEMAARQAAPVQMAQAAPQAGAPVADLPAQGAAQAQGFAIPQAPGADIPPGDPSPQVPTQALIGWMANPRLPQAQRDLVKSIVENRQKWAQQNAGPTGDMKEYELYRRQELAKGRQPEDLTPWLRANKASGASSVNIDQRAQTEEEKALGQAAGKRAGEMMAAAASGTKQLQRLGQLEALMKNVETGRLQPGRMTMAALGKSLGVNEDFLRGIGLDPAQVGDAQALNSITGRMVVDMIGSGGFPANNFSDADRAFITGTVPSLANDPRGNKLIMEVAKRTAQIDIEKAKAWRDWRKTNKGGSFDDFEVDWNEKLGSKDRFADLAKQAEAITGQRQQPAATDWQDLGGGIRIREKR